MSVRYGIDLVLQPSFTARVYQVRQIVCGQYASWAAEMQPLRMALTPYFPCPDDRLPTLASQVEGIARDTGANQPYTLRRSGILAVTGTRSVVMQLEVPEPLFELQSRCVEDARSHSVGPYESQDFRPCIALLEYGTFPEEMTLDVARFAGGVASGLDMAETAHPWRLQLTRYSSEAAGDDWSRGHWASDLSWQHLASHALYAGATS